jgi:hypothetical protein
MKSLRIKLWRMFDYSNLKNKSSKMTKKFDFLTALKRLGLEREIQWHRSSRILKSVRVMQLNAGSF